MGDQNQVIIKTYKGIQANATAAFQADSARMAAQGYFPTSQSWAPGAYGCGAFLGALILCFVVVGFLIFVYMLIVKPDGTLTVTYELRAVSEEKTCPKCSEQVKAAALVCRFCGHQFTVASAVSEKTKFTVILTSAGTRRLGVLKQVRAITGLDLNEAIDLVEAVPNAVKVGISKDEAEKIKKQFEELGAKVELK